MKFLAKFKITGVDNFRTPIISGKKIPVATIICTCAVNDAFTADVFGAEKVQFCKEMLTAGTTLEGIFNIVGTAKPFVSKNGRDCICYNNTITLKYLMTSEKIPES